MKNNDILYTLGLEALGILLRWGADKLSESDKEKDE